MNKFTDIRSEIILPYNLLAEKLILGSLLTTPEAIYLVSEKLPIEAFYLDSHQIIYKGLLILYAQGKTLDYINLVTWLQDNGLLTKIGGSQVLLELIAQLTKVNNLNEYIGLIYEKYIRRSLIKLGEEIIEDGYLTELPLETIFSNIEEHFLRLSQKKTTQNLRSIEDGLKDILKEIENGLRLSPTTGLTTKFIELDVLTQGFQNSDLIIIAGRPSMGKTAFAFNIAKNIVEIHQTPVIFFSLEMTKQQLLYRLLASELEISNLRLRAARIKKTEWLKVKTIIHHLSKLKLFIDDTPNLSLGEIKRKVKNLNLELVDKKVGLIILDYLQLLEGEKETENRVQELSKIMRSLKKLARDLNIPIIVLSQLSRNVESRVNKRPLLSDLRESGCLKLVDNYFHQLGSKSFQDSLIWSWNGVSLSKENNFKAKLTGQKPIYRIDTLSGRSLFITSNHKIFTFKGWKKIEQLNLNDFVLVKLLFTSINFTHKLKNTIVWDKILKVDYFYVSFVFDMEVLKTSNYFTNNILVHNSIEQDADVVLMLYRDEYYYKETADKNIIEIIISKHRNGPIGTTKLVFDSKYLRFFNS